LLLIKHSLPEIDSNLAASQWHLSKTGRTKCFLLAEKLPSSIDIFISSCEPKAVETAQLLAQHCGKEWEILPGLQEHDRTNVPLLPQGQFEALIAQFFRKPNRLVMGRETAEQASRRFDAAIRSAITKHREKRIAVVSHGTVISLYVGKSTENSYDLWRRLGLPSFVVLRMPERQVLQVVEQI